MKTIHHVFLGLGSNEGDSRLFLQQARALIASEIGRICRASAIYRTAAWGVENQHDYLNQVIEVQTALSPLALLQKTMDIERRLGRKRLVRWGSRTIDIDLLYYDRLCLHTAELHLPHPRIPERRFVLVPMTEIAPDWLHPQLHKTQTELLAACPDTGKVEKTALSFLP
jgi:2-amino-4-hydroxy-6-hydroxymethyldihydropteridine diphosphokinase